MSQPILVVENTPIIKKRKLSRMKIGEAMWAYVFIAPVVLGLAALYMIPALISLWYAFTNYDGLTTMTFVGLDNFSALVKDQTFIRTVLNTVVYTVGTVPPSIALGIVLAVLLNSKIKGMVIYRTLYYIPVITMPIAVGMVWKWLYNSKYGLINNVLGSLHLPQPNWLFDERFALFSIVLVAIWSAIGFNAVILLSGLQGIPSTYYEAASLDGASDFRKLIHITFPLLTPSIFFVLVLSLINSLQVFDLVFIIMGDQQSLLESTRTVVYSIWEQGFKNFNMGYASAQAWLLFLVILLITIVQMYFQKKWVHYQ